MKKLFTLISLMAVSYVSNAQTVTGGDMETWKSYTSLFTTHTRPDGWFTNDSLYTYLKVATGGSYSGRVTKSTTIKHGGTACAKLVNAADSLPSFITNANIEFDLGTGDVTYNGGTVVTKRINFVNAFAQYATLSSDSGVLFVEAYKNGIGAGGADSIVGYGEIYIKPSTGFKSLSAEIVYDNATVVPDRIIIGFFTNTADVPVAGTTLYVDDVTLSDITGIETPMINDNNIKVFPNPAVNNLHISTELNEDMTVSMYNAAGQLVHSQAFRKNADVTVSSLASGNYIYVISGAEGHKYYSATFSKQ